MTSRVFTRFYYTVKPYMYKEKCPAPGGHVVHPTETIFKLVQDSIGAHVLTKFHEDWT